VSGYSTALELSDSNQEFQLQVMTVPERSPWVTLMGLALMRWRRRFRYKDHFATASL
jgi:hypothetical protein